MALWQDDTTMRLETGAEPGCESYDENSSIDCGNRVVPIPEMVMTAKPGQDRPMLTKAIQGGKTPLRNRGYLSGQFEGEQCLKRK